MGALRTNEVFKDSRLTVIALESIDLHQSKTKTGCKLFANIQPIAVIVCSPDGIYALDMEAAPANFEQLRQDLPDLDAMIATFDRA